MPLFNMDDMIPLHHYRPTVNINANNAVHSFCHSAICNRKAEIGSLLRLLVHTKNSRAPFQCFLVC